MRATHDSSIFPRQLCDSPPLSAQTTANQTEQTRHNALLCAVTVTYIEAANKRYVRKGVETPTPASST